jgi:AraC family transcriptional regulator
MVVATRSVPVSMGSPQSRTLETEQFAITEAWFPARRLVPRHSHERACAAFMLGGAFDLRLTGHTHYCSPTSVFTEPQGEPHANRMGNGGAHVIVLQPDPAQPELPRRLRAVLERVSHQRHAGLTERAARLTRELDAPDDLGPLAAEAIALELLVMMARIEATNLRPPPSWLLRAQELLHERFAGPLRLSEVAQAVEIHPAHLARTFREHFKFSMGSYVRRLRLEWAAEELVRSDSSLAAIALAAGFADQSHFTRAFKHQAGITPSVYRASRRSGALGRPR